MKPIRIFSRSSGFICPWPMATLASGTYFLIRPAISGRLLMRSFTKNTCPLRLISKLMASAITSLSNVCTSVLTG